MFPPAHTPAGAYASILQEIIFDYSYTYDTKNFARYQWGGGNVGVNVLVWSVKAASLTSYGRGG